MVATHSCDLSRVVVAHNGLSVMLLLFCDWAGWSWELWFVFLGGTDWILMLLLLQSLSLTWLMSLQLSHLAAWWWLLAPYWKNYFFLERSGGFFALIGADWHDYHVITIIFRLDAESCCWLVLSDVIAWNCPSLLIVLVTCCDGSVIRLWMKSWYRFHCFTDGMWSMLVITILCLSRVMVSLHLSGLVDTIIISADRIWYDCNWLLILNDVDATVLAAEADWW